MLRNKFWTRAPPPKTPSTPNDVKFSYEELMLGVWRVLVMKDSRFSMPNFGWKQSEDPSQTFPLLCRAVYDVYTISPRLFAHTIMTQFWFAIEGPLSLYFSNRLLFFVSELSSPRSVLTGVTRSRREFQEASQMTRYHLSYAWQ